MSNRHNNYDDEEEEEDDEEEEEYDGVPPHYAPSVSSPDAPHERRSSSSSDPEPDNRQHPASTPNDAYGFSFSSFCARMDSELKKNKLQSKDLANFFVRSILGLTRPSTTARSVSNSHSTPTIDSSASFSVPISERLPTPTMEQTSSFGWHDVFRGKNLNDLIVKGGKNLAKYFQKWCYQIVKSPWLADYSVYGLSKAQEAERDSIFAIICNQILSIMWHNGVVFPEAGSQTNDEDMPDVPPWIRPAIISMLRWQLRVFKGVKARADRNLQALAQPLPGDEDVDDTESSSPSAAWTLPIATSSSKKKSKQTQ